MLACWIEKTWTVVELHESPTPLFLLSPQHLLLYKASECLQIPLKKRRKQAPPLPQIIYNWLESPLTRNSISHINTHSCHKPRHSLGFLPFHNQTFPAQRFFPSGSGFSEHLQPILSVQQLSLQEHPAPVAQWEDQEPQLSEMGMKATPYSTRPCH